MSTNSHQPNPDSDLDTNEPTLADTDESQEERGRIGYGKNERTSSWLLGAALILIVLAIGAWQWFGNGDDDDSGNNGSVDTPMIGAEAPGFTLHTFTGEDVSLEDQRGKVVILNFWGSWCEPCKREMPAFQAYWESAPADVMMIGVGAKQDSEEKSREFAESFGITYPIGRDDGGDRVTTGVIATNYTITFYPMTYFINPDGVVSSLVVGELDEDDLDDYVQKARGEVTTSLVSPIAMDTRRRDS